MSAATNTCQETGASIDPLFWKTFPDFTIDAPGDVTVAWTGLTGGLFGTLYLYVINAADDIVATGTGDDNHPDSSLVIALERGTYHIEVFNFQGLNIGPTTVTFIVTGAGCPAPSNSDSGAGLLAVLALAAAGAGAAVLAVRHEQAKKRSQSGQQRRRRT